MTEQSTLDIAPVLKPIASGESISGRYVKSHVHASGRG